MLTVKVISFSKVESVYEAEEVRWVPHAMCNNDPNAGIPGPGTNGHIEIVMNGHKVTENKSLCTVYVMNSNGSTIAVYKSE